MCPRQLNALPQLAFLRCSDKAREKADALVLARTYRHGNYDYATNTVVWDLSSTARTLPASLYLSQKPAFFGTNPWPWVDPTASTDAGRLGVLPAKARFDALHGPGP